MSKRKKTFIKSNYQQRKQKPRNFFCYLGENINMTKKTETNNQKCKVISMPTPITDEDLSALFNGILNVVKKKFELDTKSEIISLNANVSSLVQELKEKQAECNRMKNEILYLKSQLNRE